MTIQQKMNNLINKAIEWVKNAKKEHAANIKPFKNGDIVCLKGVRGSHSPIIVNRVFKDENNVWKFFGDNHQWLSKNNIIEYCKVYECKNYYKT